MNVRVALLQIASQHPKSGQNGGGRMPRNPWPDQIGMGGRITPEYAIHTGGREEAILLRLAIEQVSFARI